MNDRRSATLHNVILLATGRDLEVELLSEATDVVGVLRLLSDVDTPTSVDPLITDIRQVLAGQRPIYFLSKHERADLYQLSRGHGADAPASEDNEPKSISEIVPEIDKELALGDLEVGAFGVALYPIRELGWACPREAVYFLRSDEWRHCAESVIYCSNHRCDRCERDNVSLAVYHQAPPLSMFARNFSDNFDEARLTTLCANCHAELKVPVNGSETRESYVAANSDEAKVQSARLRLLWQAHDTWGKCSFCNSAMAGGAALP